MTSTETAKARRLWLRAVILTFMVGGFWEPVSLYIGIALFGVYVFSK